MDFISWNAPNSENKTRIIFFQNRSRQQSIFPGKDIYLQASETPFMENFISCQRDPGKSECCPLKTPYGEFHQKQVNHSKMGSLLRSRKASVSFLLLQSSVSPMPTGLFSRFSAVLFSLLHPGFFLPWSIYSADLYTYCESPLKGAYLFISLDRDSYVND